MRIAAPLALLALLAGCATAGTALDRPPAGAYRIPGRAADPLPFSADEGALIYALAPGHGTEYGVDAMLTDGEVRIAVVIGNRGGAPLRYDLRRLAVTGAGGERLELAALREDPSRRPTPEERTRADHRAGVRQVLPGEKVTVTRRYRLPDAAAGDAARRLGALALDDELLAGDAVVPVTLHLERAR